MREQYLHDKEMFDFNAGAYCGVYMPTHVMKKIARLAAQYSNDVKKVLNEHANELLVSDWTLANKLDDNGKILKQVTIRFARKNDEIRFDNVAHRISLFKPPQPIRIKELYIVESREQAEEIANEILLEELSTESTEQNNKLEAV